MLATIIERGLYLIVALAWFNVLASTTVDNVASALLLSTVAIGITLSKLAISRVSLSQVI